MELTEEEYKQVLRYADNEMDAAERKAFEAVLIQNVTLRKEVEFYKEISSIGESIFKKMCAMNKDTHKEKTIPDEVLRMIKQARTNWETHGGNYSKQKQNIPLREIKSISARQRAIENNEQPVPVDEKENAKRSAEEAKVKKFNPTKWLAAAVLAGFVCLAVTFQYLRNKSADREMVYNKTKPDSKATVDNKNPESHKKNNHSDTTSFQINSSASDNASSHNSKVQNRISIEKGKREKLFAENFERDNLPAEIPEPLEDPSAFYKDQKPEKAIPEYNLLLADIKDAEISGIEARGEDIETGLIAFYAHYYLAQSYMSVNNMTNAIHELRKAISKAPDKIWKTKVQWYLSLAFLKTGQISRAEALLKEVANNKKANDYKQRAVRLVNELKND